MKKLALLCCIALSTFMVTAQVGIGTTNVNSSAALEIKSSTRGLLLPRTSTTTRLAMTGAKGLMVYDTTAGQIYFHNGTSWQLVTTGNHPATYWSQVGTNIYNTNTGNVGIGLNIPTSKLSVGGDVYVQQGEVNIYGDNPLLKISGDANAGAARLRFIMPNDDPDFTITQSLGSLWISRYTGITGFVADLMVSSTGLVGIGSATPEVRCTIDNGTDVGNAAGGYLQLGVQSNYNIGIDNNEMQARYNGGVSRLILNAGGGAVQIGSATAPTGYSLAVNGKAICEELKIQASSNWPDYVFSDQYPLRAISELKSFIEANNHLPNIPSATEIETDGIIVGDMQKKMMEKIEELTLYIIQLEEKTNRLEREIENVKAGTNPK